MVLERGGPPWRGPITAVDCCSKPAHPELVTEGGADLFNDPGLGNFQTSKIEDPEKADEGHNRWIGVGLLKRSCSSRRWPRTMRGSFKCFVANGVHERRKQLLENTAEAEELRTLLALGDRDHPTLERQLIG